jgi:hypothetical protein
MANFNGDQRAFVIRIRCMVALVGVANPATCRVLAMFVAEHAFDHEALLATLVAGFCHAVKGSFWPISAYLQLQIQSNLTSASPAKAVSYLFSYWTSAVIKSRHQATSAPDIQVSA